MQCACEDSSEQDGAGRPGNRDDGDGNGGIGTEMGARKAWQLSDPRKDAGGVT